MVSKSIAFGLKTFFQLKQKLRDKHVNEKLHDLTFKFRNKNNLKQDQLRYSFSEIDKDLILDQWKTIDLKLPENSFLRKITFEFMYLNMENINELEVYKAIGTERKYIFKGKSKVSLLQFYE